MPAAQAHDDQRTRNEDLARLLGGLALSGPLDGAARQWQVVMLFYAAVHWVESILAPQHSQGHSDRQARMIARWPGNPIGGRAYRDLRVMSERARYGCWIPAASDVTDARRNLADVMRELV